MGEVFGWDAARRTREIDNYVARVEAERESQTMPTTSPPTPLGWVRRTSGPSRPVVVIFVDRPRWPGRGRLWSHLVSDVSFAELHAFAEALGAPRRGFDRDHYDIPEGWYATAIWLGAHPVPVEKSSPALSAPDFAAPSDGPTRLDGRQGLSRSADSSRLTLARAVLPNAPKYGRVEQARQAEQVLQNGRRPTMNASSGT
jgi:hypothetical protein